MTLTLNIYSKTKDFPDSEKFGLTSQLRRAAISVSSNIAEGSGRQSNKEFVKLFDKETIIMEIAKDADKNIDNIESEYNFL